MEARSSIFGPVDPTIRFGVFNGFPVTADNSRATPTRLASRIMLGRIHEWCTGRCIRIQDDHTFMFIRNAQFFLRADH